MTILEETNDNNHRPHSSSKDLKGLMGGTSSSTSVNASTSNNSSSSTSRISIKIPRTVLNSTEDANEHHESDRSSIEEMNNEEEQEEATKGQRKLEDNDLNSPNDADNNQNTKDKPNNDFGGKSRRGQKDNDKDNKRKAKSTSRKRKSDDSEESAYSESEEEDEEDETESEEVYTEEEEEDESDSIESEEYEEDESEEEWDDRRRKYVKRESRGFAANSAYQYQYRNTMAPSLIPFQYTGMPNYAPIAPMPPSMASIPMFAKFAATQQTLPKDITTEQGKGENQVFSGGEEDKKESSVPSSVPLQNHPGAIQIGSTNLTPEQLQEIARKTAASLVSGASGPARVMLPRNPDGSVVQPSPELKQAVASMLVASPEWRQALLAKLQMNQKITAEQAAKMGLNPAVGISNLAGTMPTMVPIMRAPVGIRPLMPITMYRPPGPTSSTIKFDRERKKRGRKKGSKLVSPTESTGDVPLAARRERRTPRKAVDYSQFFKDDEEGDDDEDRDESASEEGEGDDSTSSSPRMKKSKGRSLFKRPRPTYRDDSEEEFNSGSEDEFSASRTSEDVGVEKILSHRVGKDGKNEFYVKFHNLSYLHCEWISEEEMLEESMGTTRIKKFLSKPLSMRHYSDKHIFNPEFTEIERIVHGWEHPDDSEPPIMVWSFLVKWVGLPYSSASWEKRSTLEELPDGSDRLREYESRPTLEEKKKKTSPPGYRPDRSSYNKFEASPTYKGGNTLRSYQLEGLNWLVYCWINRQSCIIADEMGLGKTVQSVSFLDLIYQRYGICGPFLIVAPLSTIPHWQREFEAWSNLNCIIYHGDSASREMMREYEFYYKNAEDKPISTDEYFKFDVLITTYEMALAGIEHLQTIPWRVAVFDEAHRLKNRASKATETLKALQIEHKILLTGTPLQNNVEELWSLLNFLQPQRFFSESQFLDEYGNLKRSEDVIRLQELLKPLMLRRLKEDVETSIPVKEETVIEVELTSVQKRYYRAILERNFAFLTKGCAGANAPNLINAMMELRKCCIHPYLIKGAEERILVECNANSPQEQMQCMIQASGKLVLVDKLLKRLRENGHRVLIFSQMTRCLDLLVDYLKWRGYPFERIDGAIRGDLRQAAIDRFCDPKSDSFVFLLCTRAGGVGINLTAADTVVIFDSDWNPQNDIQAQARCHRIGQTKSVKVYRLLTRNTYEREMFDKAGLKLGLDKAVLQKMRPGEDIGDATSTAAAAAHNPQLSKKEVETLLKKGAYGLLMENDEDAIRFCEEDIDQILERRTTVIRHEAGKTAAEAGGSIFSKASFAATADDMDIDIDDPNFWELWARRLDLDPRQLLSSSGVVVDEPRIKRQARRLRQEDLSMPELKTILEEALLDQATLSIPTDRKKKKVAKLVEPNPWTSSERARFLTFLVNFGIHRYAEMVPLFPNRSKNDLIACTRAIIKMWLEASTVDKDEKGQTGGGGEDSKFREDCEKLLLAHLDFDRTVKVLEEAVDEATGEIDLAAAEAELQDAEESTVSSGGTSLRSSRKKPYSKADIPYVGASHNQIVEFKSFLGEAPEKLLLALKAHSRTILLRLQLLDFIRQLVESHATVVAKKKSGGPGGRRTKASGGGGESEEIEYHLPMPPMIGAAPVRGWNKTFDEALVIGVFRHGLGAYDEIRADPKLAFASITWNNEKGEVEGEKEKEEEKIEDETLPSMEWPEPMILEDRLKKVILAMEKRTQAAAKLAIQASKANAEGLSGGRRRTAANIMAGEDEMYRADEEEEETYSGRKRRAAKGKKLTLPAKTKRRGSKRGGAIVEDEKERRGSPDGKMSAKWSKKDKNEFQRIVLFYGLPPFRDDGTRDWPKFRKLGNFSTNISRANDEIFEEYKVSFVKACKTAASRRGRKTGEAEEVEEEEVYREQEEGKANKDDTLGALFIISTERAKRALARIELLEKLRQQILSLQDLVSYLGRARKTSGLPAWWITPDHDASLLVGVGRYGFGQWESMIGDEELPFNKVYSEFDQEGMKEYQAAISTSNRAESGATETPSTRTGRRKKTVNQTVASPIRRSLNLSLIGWPPEGTLVRRVETLMEMIVNEERRRSEPPLETKKRSKSSSEGKKSKKQKSLFDFGLGKSTAKEEGEEDLIKGE